MKGQSEYDYPDIAETTSQETPRSVVGSDAIPAYSTAPTTDSRYYENDGYTVDDMTQKLSSSTVTPVTYVTNSTESRHSPYGHGNLYQNGKLNNESPYLLMLTYNSASAPAGGYMGNHPGSASSVTSGIDELHHLKSNIQLTHLKMHVKLVPPYRRCTRTSAEPQERFSRLIRVKKKLLICKLQLLTQSQITRFMTRPTSNHAM